MGEDFYISLIYKDLAEEITSQEKEKLQQWYHANPKNQLTYDAVAEAWNASDVLNANLDDVDVQEEFKALEMLMEDEPQSASPEKAIVRKITPQRRWLAIAASLLLLVTAAALLNNLFNKPANTENIIALATQSESKTVVLADGSTVYLNKNSSLKYPDAFSETDRVVQLEGEAFFEVKHQDNQPFKVKTAHETITVLGTSFNVAATIPNKTTVYVATGKVQVQQQGIQDRIVLTKGEMGVSDTQKQELSKTSNASQNEIAWHTKTLEFSNTSLPEIERQLEAFYGVAISLDNPSLKNCTFTSSFKAEPIENVFEALSTVLDLQVEAISHDEYKIKGAGCN